MNTRRKFDPEFKAKVVLELIRGEKGVMQASREYQIKDTVLSRWKQEFLEKAPGARAGQIAHINRTMPHSWDKKVLA